MTVDEIDLVETSFARLGAVTQALGAAFYARLFEIDPSVRPLFHHSMETQALKLMQVLSFCVSNLREPEKLLPAVRDLGRRHIGYGVAQHHYETVGMALLHTLRASLGDAWTADVESAWRGAYDTIAAEMISGAATA